MPTYKPLGTNISLVTCSLADSTATKPARSKNLAGEDTRRTEQALLTATPLTETHIACFGDDTRLHFLGDVPFYLVQAGDDLFKPKQLTLVDRAKTLITQRQEDHAAKSVPQMSQNNSTASNGTQESDPKAPTEGRRSEMASEVSMPQALGLVITLPIDTFIPSFNDKQRSYNGTKFQCVKFDVFFNGELTSSDFQSSRYRQNRGGRSEPSFEDGNIRVASGKRVGMVIERPWVIIPPSQNAGGSLREAKRSKAAGAAERWHALGEALLQRADEQGYNVQEERSPLGQYLASLAAMEMPEAVENMQIPGGHKFGVIDVVLTAGYGVKGQGTHHYIFGPEPLRDSRNFKRMPEGWQPTGTKAQSIGRQSINETTDSIPLAFQGKANATNLPSVTIATTREKRNIATPTSYRETAPRRSRTSTPELGSSAPTKRTSILPAFPAIPQIDFNDAIAITPTKAEQARKNRGLQISSPAGDADTREKQSTASASMPPPPIPIPRSLRTNKRRFSDTISPTENFGPPSAAGTWSARPGAVSGSKSVSGFMGMTRRGIFSKTAGTRSALQHVMSSESDAAPTIDQWDESTIIRVVIKAKETLILDKMLTTPYKPGKKERLGLDGLSQHQPLHESVVFGLKDLKNKKADKLHTTLSSSTSTHAADRELIKLIQPPPPTTTSPPEAKSIEASSASAVHAPTPPPTQPQTSIPMPQAAQVKFDDPLEETRATWRTPELSEDCVISYVEEGDWLTAAGGGSVLRHIKSGRAGVFTENEVLFAVRYIVAGEAGSSL